MLYVLLFRRATYSPSKGLASRPGRNKIDAATFRFGASQNRYVSGRHTRTVRAAACLCLGTGQRRSFDYCSRPPSHPARTSQARAVDQSGAATGTRETGNSSAARSGQTAAAGRPTSARTLVESERAALTRFAIRFAQYSARFSKNKTFGGNKEESSQERIGCQQKAQTTSLR